MTIAENEQLKAEVAYHIHQTQIMFQLNESLDKEKSEVSRSLQLTKEVIILFYTYHVFF